MHSPNVSHLSSSTSVKPERIWVCWVLLKYFYQPTHCSVNWSLQKDGLDLLCPPFQFWANKYFLASHKSIFSEKKYLLGWHKHPRPISHTTGSLATQVKPSPNLEKILEQWFFSKKQSFSKRRQIFLSPKVSTPRSGAIFQTHFCGNKINVSLMPTLASRP